MEPDKIGKGTRVFVNYVSYLWKCSFPYERPLHEKLFALKPESLLGS